MTIPRNNMPNSNHNPNSGNFAPNYSQNHSNSRNFARPYPYPYHRFPPGSGYAMDQEHPRGPESPDLNLVRSQSSVTSPLTHEEYEDLAKSMRNDFQSSQNRCVKMSKFKASPDKSRLVDLMRSLRNYDLF